jgi:hypothetical protein
VSVLEKIDYGLTPRYQHVHTAGAGGDVIPGAEGDVLIAHVGSYDVYASEQFGIVCRFGDDPGDWTAHGDTDRIAIAAVGVLAIFTSMTIARSS